MKKILSAVAAVGLAVAMGISSLAYVASPEKSSESQINLVSIKAVDIQTAITGVRSYSELTDTTSGYQVNDVIYLATTVEVRNLEKSKYSNLKSIVDKDVDVIVGSPYIDLSYSKYASPILLSHIYSGINDTAIGTFADVVSVSTVLDYDKDKNEVEFTFRGYEQNAVTWLSGFSTSTYNSLYLSAYVQNSKVYIPALRARDGKTTVTLGNSTYTYEWDAPESMAYTLVLTGVTKDNAGAEQGDFYAKILLSGSEEFEDEGVYYIRYDGTPISSSQITANSYVEFIDYVTVKVSSLEIDNAYNVYKYEVPSSGMIDTEVPIIYVGDDDDYEDEVLAKVNPNMWDYGSSKSSTIGKTSVNVAGGLTNVESWYTYTYDSTTKKFTASSKKDVPLTSVVYTEYCTIYAPAYYGVAAGSQNQNIGVAVANSFALTTPTANVQKTVVTSYVFNNVMFDAVPTGRNFDVTVWDTFSSRLVSSAYYSVSYSGSGTGPYTITVMPVASTVYPQGSTQDSTTAQCWNVMLGTPVTVPALGAAINTETTKTAALYDSTWNYTTATTVSALNAGALAGMTPTPPTTLPLYYILQAGTTKPTDVAMVANTNAASPYNGSDGLTFTADLAVGANMTSQGVLSTNTTPKTVALTASKIYATFVDNVTGAAVDLSNATITGVNGVWANGNAGGFTSGTSILDATLTTANAAVSGSGVEFTPAKPLNTSAWTSTDTESDYSLAYMYGDFSGVSGANATGVITPWPTNTTYVAGWAEKNTSGALNARVEIQYSYPGGNYNYSTGTTGTNVNMWQYYDVIEDGHNGIDVYVITYNSDDQPLIAVATEAAYFDSQDGLSIAVFDAYNESMLGTRMNRSSNTLTYATGAGYVDGSSKLITALQYFGLDTALSTTYRVIEDTFEAKGAAAAYSDNVTGTFKYGTLTLVGEQDIDEGTPETEVDDSDDEELIDDGGDDLVDDGGDDEPAPAPATGDSSVNIAIALAAAAIVAAAGLVFVMKKAR